ncbi:MAG: UDP-N-acetylmuramoyl-L-alanine--D-glutamate ligase [Legionella sp.]|nr:MAG: UDP-N-acetylmuramoyl-L-alanine--D-glutamate ligase [Legionella sp.]PJD98052.1 MAG: UDP-N-acetylmuramoyl-L-alanine--D-glutamate ligase [Legionella sp.]
MNHSFYLVVGLGKTGLSIARYLQQNNQAFVLFDTRKDAAGISECQVEFPSVPLYLEELPELVFAQVTEIITSPGLSLDLPLFVKARQRGLPVYGDIECLARAIKAPVIAITGTNGKSTVTTLVGEMAKAAGIRVAVAGNIGTPVLQLLGDGESYDLWVLELSSFQLDLTSSLNAQVATVLNISPDHLDRHHSLDGYVKAKQRIYHHAQYCLYNRDDEATRPDVTTDAPNACYSFGFSAPVSDWEWGLIRQGEQYFIAKGQEQILAVDRLLIKGTHNWLNALAACALADRAGIPQQAMQEVLTSFSGLKHRCQWVRTLNDVDWINDSKGTNIGATISAINGVGSAMQGRIVLIAGGQGKGADFHDLRQSVADYVRTVVLIGEDAMKIEQALCDVVSLSHAASLEEAVMIAYQEAKAGDVVLLSPACASLDMFNDYNHRGEVFAAAVTGL